MRLIASDLKLATAKCIVHCLSLCYSYNPTDFPKVWFPFAILVARDTQLIIHKHVGIYCDLNEN